MTWFAHRRVGVTGVCGAALLGSSLLAVAIPANGAVACAVDYQVINQWPGGFQGSVTLRNTGDAVSTWTLTFTFPDGQSVSQGWGGEWRTGSTPSVSGASWNSSLGSGGAVSLGFIGSWNGANGAARDFRFNGVACSGSGSSSTSPTTTTTTASRTTSTTTTTTTTTAPRTTTTTTRSSTTVTSPAAYPYPGNVTGSTGAHDPTVVKRPDGSYLVATTGRGIPLKTSTDRTAWRAAGSAFTGSMPWTSPYTTGDMWAPDLNYLNGQYYLYYSASTFGSSNSGIFLATSSSGDSGTWTNRGQVIGTTSSSNYNAIDPDLIVDAQGQWWLSFGSFWSGIKLIRIDPSTGLRSGSEMYSIASRSGGIEAADIFRAGDYYYLYVSFDRCCQGAASTYRIMVGRSRSITGPYVDRNGVAMTSGGGTQVLAGHGSIHGPGHSATLQRQRRRRVSTTTTPTRARRSSASISSATTPPAGPSSTDDTHDPSLIRSLPSAAGHLVTVHSVAGPRRSAGRALRGASRGTAGAPCPHALPARPARMPCWCCRAGVKGPSGTGKDIDSHEEPANPAPPVVGTVAMPVLVSGSPVITRGRWPVRWTIR